MSKKTRFKKKNKQKIQKKIAEFHEESVEESSSEDSDSSRIVSVKNKDTQPDSIIDEQTQRLISKDVRIIIITVVGLAIILTAIKILDLKTDYISNLGNWLYKAANIQTM